MLIGLLFIVVGLTLAALLVWGGRGLSKRNENVRLALAFTSGIYAGLCLLRLVQAIPALLMSRFMNQHMQGPGRGSDNVVRYHLLIAGLSFTVAGVLLALLVRLNSPEVKAAVLPSRPVPAPDLSHSAQPPSASA